MGLSKIGELLMKNSFSVEHAIIYFTVIVVTKQVLLPHWSCFTYSWLNAFLTAYAIVFFFSAGNNWTSGYLDVEFL